MMDPSCSPYACIYVSSEAVQILKYYESGQVDKGYCADRVSTLVQDPVNLDFPNMVLSHLVTLDTS